MNLLELDFPKYVGLESQYEYVVYNYLEKVFRQKGYILKIKKTNFENVDKNIMSVAGSGRASCDAYVFSDNSEKDLFALVELESNKPSSKLKEGIIQVRKYANSLSDRYLNGSYITNNMKIKLVVYDGQFLYLSEYDLSNKEESVIVGNRESNTGQDLDNDVKNRLFDIFPDKDNDAYARIEATEKELIKKTKDIIRANKMLQVNKAYLLTVLASIYGQTKSKTFSDALEELKSQSEENKQDAIEIKNKWDELSPKIEYNKFNVKEKIKLLYTEVAIYLYIISQDKKMDLYGFIYEELAEKTNKKEDGEYYTPRHHIRPIVSSVFRKYLKKQWNLTANNSYSKLKEKVILDPFCGSGGFLYEYLKLLKSEYNFKNNQINKIAESSLVGFDKNDIMSAYFNLFLIGDGKSNLVQVKSSINWQNVWRYEIVNGKETELGTPEKLKRSLNDNIVTIKAFLNVLVDIKKTFEDFYINENNLSDIESIYDFIEQDEILEKEQLPPDKTYNFFDDLILSKEKENCVLKYFYNKLLKYSDNLDGVPNLDSFINNLGRVDYLATNVPYGSIDDVRFKNGYGSRLESVALKECIDLLKPATTSRGSWEGSRFIPDENGELFSNQDGGIATIVIPNGILERDEIKLREYLLKRCDILSIIKLPFYTFSPYALIQTFVITIQKKAVFQFDDLNQNKNVFFYIVDNDGRANSDKRYPTQLINPVTTQILDKRGTSIGSLHEFLHDELELNLEKYPEGYYSKLERAWIFGMDNGVNDNWNQKRYTEQWDGEKWGEINSTNLKWSYKKIVKRTYEKQIEKKSAKLLELFKEKYLSIDDFSELSIEEQKEIIEIRIKESIVNNIMKVEKKGDIIVIEPNKIVNKINFVNYFKENIVGDIIYNSSNIAELREILLRSQDLRYIKEVEDLIKVLYEIDEVLFDENGNATFYVNEHYEEYDLVPEHYLDERENEFSVDEIMSNLRRFKNMLKS